MEKITSQEEQELYQALTSMTHNDLWGKINIPKGRKVAFEEILEKFRGYDFRSFYALQELAVGKSIHTEEFKEYMNTVRKHPIVDMLASFMQCGLLDKKLNKKEGKLIPLGEELLPKKKLQDRRIHEGIILPDGNLLPIKSTRAHRIGVLWLYVNGYDVENVVRYTSSFLGNCPPLFSSASDYICRKTNNLFLTDEQARAIYNIYCAKYGAIRKPFENFAQDSNDFCLSIFGDEKARKHNANTFEQILGRDIFNAKEVLKQIHDESYLS